MEFLCNVVAAFVIFAELLLLYPSVNRFFQFLELDFIVVFRRHFL